MVMTAIVLFLVAALFGIYMAMRIFGGALPPWAAVILHGLLAASGLAVLLYALYTGAQSTMLLVGTGLLVVAALGGFVMFSYQLRKAPPPKALVVIHALAAVAGVVVLLGDTLGMV
jgi:hypothetical protein